MIADEKRLLEGELVRKCIRRTESQCNVINYLSYKVRVGRMHSELCLFVLLGFRIRVPSPPVPGASHPLRFRMRPQIVYRRYASLFFILGVDQDENELAMHEFIHAMVENLDAYFGNVCELDVMFQLGSTHFLIDEMIANEVVVDINRQNVLSQVQVLAQAADSTS